MWPFKSKLSLKYDIAWLLVFFIHGAALAAEEKAPDAAAGSASPESIEYMKLESKLNTLKSKVVELEQQFTETSKAIEESKDTQKRSELARQLIEIAKNRNAAAKEYMDVREDTRYRFPSKGEALDRKYLAMKPKSTEELKKTHNIDETLTELKEHVDRKYAPLKPKIDPSQYPEPAQPEAPQPVSEAKPSKPKKKLRLVK